MSERVLEELVRIIAYGGFGVFLGYVVGLWTNDRHTLITTVLHEAERDMPTRRPFLSPARIQSIIAIFVMVALLLAGVSLLRSESEAARQNERDCRTIATISDTLRERTQVYREAARPERDLWRDLRRTLLAQGIPARSDLVRSIDVYLTQQESYIRHLKRNPYPKNVLQEC